MAAQPQEDEATPVIHFKDAVGRKFAFPFDMVQEWQGMEELVKIAFMQVDVLGPHVQEGHYDLIGPRGEILLPPTWHALIRPGMSITMTMWPIEKPPQRPQFRPPPVFPRPPPGNAPLPPGGNQGPPPLVPTAPPENTMAVVNAGDQKGTSKPKNSAVLTFLAGKPVKKMKSDKITSKPSVPPTSHNRPSQTQPVPPDKVPNMAGSYQGMPPPYPMGGMSMPGGLTGGIPGRVPTGARHGAVPMPRPPGWNPSSFAAPPARPRRRGDDSTTNDSSSETSYEDRRSDSSESIKSRSAARNAGLIIHIRRQAQERKVPGRQLTIPILEPNPTPMERTEFSSARVYPDELGPGSVALELTKHSSPPGVMSSSNSSEGERITWLNVSRTILDFAEFENIALYGGNLASNSNSRLAMESLFKAVHDKKLNKSRSNWFVQPGTVLRCDVDSGGKTVASAIFASIPQVQVDSFARKINVKFRKGVCVPRRLHETFNPYDTSFERDKNQIFRKEDGATADNILWVCETWVLIVDSVHVFTYGDPRRRPALQDNIDIREQFAKGSGERFVHVTTPEHLQFQIPVERCETFFKLQSSIEEQLSSIKDEMDVDFDDFQLKDGDGELLTAKSWSKLNKQTRDSLIQIRIEWLNDGSSAGGSTVSSSASYLSNTTVSRDRMNSVIGHDDDDEFFGIRKVSTQESETEPFALPDLHPKVPPFLGWSVLEAGSTSGDVRTNGRNSPNDDDLGESVRACLMRTETALIERHHPHVADLQKSFPALDFNAGVVQVGIENIEMHIQTLNTSRRRTNTSQTSGFDDGELAQLYRDYLSISIRALEAFAPKSYKSPVLSLYYDALSKGTQYLKGQQVVDSPQKWVISRQPIPIPGFKYSNPPLTHGGCDKCERGVIYDTPEEAMDHLRGKHLSETTSEARLREYLISLSTAADKELKKKQTELLTTSRDLVMEVATQAREIQDGVVFGERFRQPAQGVPYALLKSLQLVIALVCTVPLLLEELQSFYRHDIHQDGAESVSLSPELRDKYLLLRSTGSEITSLMKSSERALITSEESRKKEDVVKFFSSVGAHGLAMQMVSNILQEPVYNNLKAAELYRKYGDNFGSQVIRRPSKRQIAVIGAMMDEVRRLNEVTEWQYKALRSLRTVMQPETHLEPLKGLRDKTFGIEGYMVDEVDEKLREQLDLFASNLEQGQQLIDMVNEFAEITKDDHSRAIFVFTVVTVTFLPLSFVAAYLSMNGGPSNEDWDGTQALFWQIATPLAVAVGIFCMAVAWRGHFQTVKGWTDHQIERLRLWIWPPPPKEVVPEKEVEDVSDG